MSPELSTRLTAAGIAVASTAVLSVGAYLLVAAGQELEGSGPAPVTIAERRTIAPAPSATTGSPTPSPTPTATLSPSEELTTATVQPTFDPEPAEQTLGTPGGPRDPEPEVKPGDKGGKGDGEGGGGDGGGDGVDPGQEPEGPGPVLPPSEEQPEQPEEPVSRLR